MLTLMIVVIYIILVGHVLGFVHGVLKHRVTFAEYWRGSVERWNGSIDSWFNEYENFESTIARAEIRDAIESCIVNRERAVNKVCSFRRFIPDRIFTFYATRYKIKF